MKPINQFFVVEEPQRGLIKKNVQAALFQRTTVDSNFCCQV